MKNLFLAFLGTALVLNGSPLLDLTDAGLPPETGNGKSIVISDEKGKALHTSKIWQKSPHLHRRNGKDPAAYKCSSVIDTPDGVKLVTSKELAKVVLRDGTETNFSTRFNNLTKVFLVLLPDTYLLVSIYNIYWVTNEPAVTLISVYTYIVTVSIYSL